LGREKRSLSIIAYIIGATVLTAVSENDVQIEKWPHRKKEKIEKKYDCLVSPQNSV
jgi:hypothetical protein